MNKENPFKETNTRYGWYQGDLCTFNHSPLLNFVIIVFEREENDSIRLSTPLFYQAIESEEIRWCTEDVFFKELDLFKKSSKPKKEIWFEREPLDEKLFQLLNGEMDEGVEWDGLDEELTNKLNHPPKSNVIPFPIRRKKH